MQRLYNSTILHHLFISFYNKFIALDFFKIIIEIYGLETSACLQVEQRDVPGIDCAYLAMDTEEGVEVVWNEVQFSERKNFKAQEEKIQLVFENLTQLEHPNIVKFHRYWTDTHNDKPRVSKLVIHNYGYSFCYNLNKYILHIFY